MTRTIKPHKGGRTIDTHVRMTPEVQSLLKQLKLSAADLLEKAVRAEATNAGILPPHTPRGEKD